MVWQPTEYTNGIVVETAHSPSEAAQYEWEGWYRTITPPSDPDLPEGLPAYLDLDQLRAEFVRRVDIHVGPEEPTVKTRGKIWFRPKGA